MLYIVVVIGSFLIAVLIGGILFSAPAYRGPITDHFDGSKFHNPGNVKPGGFLRLLRWMISRKRGPWIRGADQVVRNPGHITTPSITFVNHSTFLIRLRDVTVLTDPIWSMRASPLSWLGPKRRTAPGIHLESLPKIDLILLSHNHYDHLDIKTLCVVYNRFKPRIYCPLGVGLYLKKNSIDDVTELDWWDELVVNSSLNIQCVPAQHFSGRGILDRDRTLWGGFILKTSKGRIFFAGDTGYSDTIFKMVGNRVGPIDISIIPIGAYKPRWFMSPVHCSPEEAVQIHQDVRSQKSIACHFGTFPLADEGNIEPIEDLKAALKMKGLPTDCFITLQQGGSVSLEKF